jgi:hypothetical protein
MKIFTKPLCYKTILLKYILTVILVVFFSFSGSFQYPIGSGFNTNYNSDRLHSGVVRTEGRHTSNMNLINIQ